MHVLISNSRQYRSAYKQNRKKKKYVYTSFNNIHLPNFLNAINTFHFVAIWDSLYPHIYVGVHNTHLLTYGHSYDTDISSRNENWNKEKKI